MKPTQEQVIAWAREAGFYPGELRAGFNLFMGFATLAYEAGRAAENEDCAQVCDSEATVEGIAQRCAAAIRARMNPLQRMNDAAEANGEEL